MIDLDALTTNAPATDTVNGPYTVHLVANTRYAEIHATHANRSLALHVDRDVAPLLAAAPALAAELRLLRAELEGTEATVIRQATILTRVARALKGDPPPLTAHSHHDLGEIAESIREALCAPNTPGASVLSCVTDTLATLADRDRVVNDLRNSLRTIEESIGQVLDAANAPSVMHTLAGRVEAIVADRDNLAKVVSEEAAQRKQWRDEIAREIPDAPATWTPADIAYALARANEELDAMKAKSCLRRATETSRSSVTVISACAESKRLRSAARRCSAARPCATRRPPFTGLRRRRCTTFARCPRQRRTTP